MPQPFSPEFMADAPAYWAAYRLEDVDDHSVVALRHVVPADPYCCAPALCGQRPGRLQYAPYADTQLVPEDEAEWHCLHIGWGHRPERTNALCGDCWARYCAIIEEEERQHHGA